MQRRHRSTATDLRRFDTWMEAARAVVEVRAATSWALVCHDPRWSDCFQEGRSVRESADLVLATYSASPRQD